MCLPKALGFSSHLYSVWAGRGQRGDERKPALTQSPFHGEVVLGLLHPSGGNNICEGGLTSPTPEARKPKLSTMKRNSQIHRAKPEFRAPLPDSNVLSSTARCVQEASKDPETSTRNGRSRAIHVEGRLVIKAQKIHDILGNYLTDNSRGFLAVESGWSIDSPASCRPCGLSSSEASPGRCAASHPFGHACCNRHPCIHPPSCRRSSPPSFIECLFPAWSPWLSAGP